MMDYRSELAYFRNGARTKGLVFKVGPKPFKRLEIFKGIEKSLLNDLALYTIPIEKINLIARLYGFVCHDGSKLSFDEVKRWKEVRILTMNQGTGDRQMIMPCVYKATDQFNPDDHPNEHDMLYLMYLYDGLIEFVISN